MQIIKPIRLGILKKFWNFKKELYFSVSVLGLSNMSFYNSKCQLFPEMQIWKIFSKEFPNRNVIIDMVFPKIFPEFLVTGFGYTVHQKVKNSCIVTVKLGSIEKSLLLTGERFLIGKEYTVPKDFEKLKIDWKYTYGGKKFTENPFGIGIEKVLKDKRFVLPLPRILEPNFFLQKINKFVQFVLDLKILFFKKIFIKNLGISTIKIG